MFLVGLLPGEIFDESNVGTEELWSAFLFKSFLTRASVFQVGNQKNKVTKNEVVQKMYY